MNIHEIRTAPLTPLMSGAVKATAPPESAAAPTAPSDSVSIAAPQQAPEPAPMTAPQPPAEEKPAPAATAPDTGGFILMEGACPSLQEPEALGQLAPSGCLSSCQIAHMCACLANSGLPLDDRSRAISDLLLEGIRQGNRPNLAWQPASDDQVKLYVRETLEHHDAMRQLGVLRGEDWSGHDLDGHGNKFNPDVAQYLAKPGRDDSTVWAIERHNSASHHRNWKDAGAGPQELKESASDIVHAWRMPRMVYDKPSWSWEKIEKVIETESLYGKLSPAQKEALIEAIPFQKDYERLFGADYGAIR